jgi:hypothetical protein
VAGLLDRLGVPLDDGRRKVRARLRDLATAAEVSGADGEEYRIRNDTLAAALRYRKTLAADPALRFP